MDKLITFLNQAKLESQKNILLCCTGSVATIKVPEIAQRLLDEGHAVIILPTVNAIHFIKAQANAEIILSKNSDIDEHNPEKVTNQPLHVNSLSDNVDERQLNTSKKVEDWSMDDVRLHYSKYLFVTDKDEWAAWNSRGDCVLHIRLRDWADICLIAPLDANTLAKVALGLCDNMVTCTVRAWDMKKPLCFCPAMNTQMYIHPFTEKHINILKELGYIEISAISKRLVCGDVGMGAMAAVDTIVNVVLALSIQCPDTN